MEKKQKIYIGMFRPPWEKITTGGGFIQCNCGSIIQTIQGTREHWQQGHFDTPVYKDIED